MNIDSLGEGKIEILFDNGLVKNVADLYDLTYKEIIGKEKVIQATSTKKERKIKFRDKTAHNIMDGIKASLDVPFPRVLYAIGIRYVGETIAKKLVAYFGSIDKIISSSYDELISVEEIGDKIAQSIVAFFGEEKNKLIIDRLRLAGVQLSVSMDKPDRLSDKLSGKAFVVSGKFEYYNNREEIHKAIEEHGGTYSGSISAKIDFLLAGEKIGSKKRKDAEKFGILILDEAEFRKMIL